MPTSSGVSTKTALEDTDKFLGKAGALPFISTFKYVYDYIKTKMYGTNEAGWNDYLIDFSTAKAAGANVPTWKDTGNGLYGMQFAAGEELQGKVHVLHDYAEGEAAYPHIHFFVDQTMTAGQQITWEVRHVCARGHAQGDSLTSAVTFFQMTYTATGAEVAGEHIVLECSVGQAFSIIEPDTIAKFAFKLVSENVAGQVFGEQADIHYLSDRVATKNKTPNFNT